MSTQSALSVKTSTEEKCNNIMYSDCSNLNLSNSQIAQAADLAFSHHKRLDLGYGNNTNEGDRLMTASNPLDSTASPSGNGHSHRLHLRKRKKSFLGSVSFLDQGVTGSTDFVSGIFRDLSQAEEEHEYSEDDAMNGNSPAYHDHDSSPFHNHEGSANSNSNSNSHTFGSRSEMNFISDDESLLSRKKRKTSANSISTFGNGNRSVKLGRNKKSYSCLRSISSALGQCLPRASASKASTDTCSTPCPEDVSYQVSPTSAYHRVTTKIQGDPRIRPMSSDATLDTDTINNLVDKVLIESLVFPSLPPTVSESSCSSNNLTQTSVQAAQVHETTPTTPIEGEMHDTKDTYGWFVDMDLQEDEDRADVILAAQETVKAGAGADDDLSFKAFTAPKKTTELDQEVEWAKAADTVDDVLGDFF